MDIADDMDSFVLTKVCLAVTHSFQRSVRGDDLNAARDLLCSEAGIHFINDFLRDTLDGGTLCIAALAFFNRQTGHIDQIGAVAILFGESFIAVHFRCFGVGGVDDRKAASLHTQFQHLEQHIPDNFIIFLADSPVATSIQNGGGALHTDGICA